MLFGETNAAYCNSFEVCVFVGLEASMAVYACIAKKTGVPFI
jgi:hypothetical protein